MKEERKRGGNTEGKLQMKEYFNKFRQKEFTKKEC